MIYTSALDCVAQIIIIVISTYSYEFDFVDFTCAPFCANFVLIRCSRLPCREQLVLQRIFGKLYMMFYFWLTRANSSMFIVQVHDQDHELLHVHCASYHQNEISILNQYISKALLATSLRL